MFRDMKPRFRHMGFNGSTHAKSIFFCQLHGGSESFCFGSRFQCFGLHVSCFMSRVSPFMCPNRRYLIPRFRIMVRPGALLIVPRRPSRRIMDVSLVAPLLVSGLVSTKAAAVTLGVTPRTTYRHLAAVSTPRPVHGLPKTWCLQQINWMQWWGVR